MIKKILIAVNDNETSTEILDTGFALAEQLGAEVGIVDVARLSFGYIDAGIYARQIEEVNLNIAKHTVKSIKEKYPGKIAADFEPVGDPVSEIRKILDEWGADLIIIGHHQRSVFRKIADTSQERRLINQIDVPVMVVPCCN